MKYVSGSNHPHNTIEIRSEFAQINTWKVEDYNSEGFSLLSTLITASGPTEGAVGTIEKKWPEKYYYKDANGAVKAVSALWKKRSQHLMEGMTLDASNADCITAMLSDKHPMIKFQIERVKIINNHTKSTILLRGAGRGKNRRLYVVAVNDIPYDQLDLHEDIGKEVHNLTERFCFLSPSKFIPQMVCAFEPNVRRRDENK